MNSQLAVDLVGIHLFAEIEGPRLVNPIIESRIPEELRPQQSLVQAFIGSLFPELCERLLEQVQSQRETWNRPPASQDLISSRTTDSGLGSSDSEVPNQVSSSGNAASTIELQSSQHLSDCPGDSTELHVSPQPRNIITSGHGQHNPEDIPNSASNSNELRGIPQPEMTTGADFAQHGIQADGAFNESEFVFDDLFNPVSSHFNPDWEDIYQKNYNPAIAGDWNFASGEFGTMK